MRSQRARFVRWRLDRAQGYFAKGAVMKAAKKLFARLVKGEEGVTMIEYGLLAALIAVAVVVIVTSIGTDLNTKFNSVDNRIKSAPN